MGVNEWQLLGVFGMGVTVGILIGLSFGHRAGKVVVDELRREQEEREDGRLQRLEEECFDQLTGFNGAPAPKKSKRTMWD